MNHKLLRLSAVLIFAGLVFYIVASLFHVDGKDANDHLDSFARYAASWLWTAVHLGQFVGRAVILSGFLCLALAFQTPSLLSRLAAVLAAVTLGLYGVLQGVDGVALKQAVDAWASAPEAEKVVRFASAEAVRWLEWGIRSYESLVFGLSMVLFAALLAQARLPKALGYMMGLSGLAYIAQGWVVGSEGFSGHTTVPSLVGYISMLIWSVWFLALTWPRKTSPQRANG